MSSTAVSTAVAAVPPRPTRPRSGVLARCAARSLQAGLLPVLLVGVPLWPVLVLSCATPLVALALPLALLDTALVAYAVAWLAYLAAGQHRAARPSPDGLFLSLLRSTAGSLPSLPVHPVRVLRVDAAALAYLVQASRVLFPAVFDWSYRSVPCPCRVLIQPWLG